MEKANLYEFLDNNKGYSLLKRCKDTTIIKLPNNQILKILDLKLLDMLNKTGYGLESRLNEVDNLDKNVNFAYPTVMLEDNGVITSYVMPEIPGLDFTNYYKNTLDLLSYANIHLQIENNIKTGNNTGLIFPDLCTTENIRITPGDKVFFIDYDGLQVKHMPAIGYSDVLGDVFDTKYYNHETELFTPELDIRSATFLYFVDTFGVDLGVVNKKNPLTNEYISVDYIFSAINLDDDDIKHKVWKLFQSSEKNEFLGEDLYKLAENYKLILPFKNAPIKTLKRK